MARLTDDKLLEVFKGQNYSETEIKHFAFGVKQPPIWLIILFFCLAVLPGAIAVALLTKQYLVALTDQRFIVLTFSGKFKVKEKSEYMLDALPPVKTSKGTIFTKIKIIDPQNPFQAKFHRLGMKNNKSHSEAIADMLEARAKPAIG